MNVGLQKTSLVNFPGRVAATVFLPGCNLRCPFCHNAELATASVVSGPHTDKTDHCDFFPIEDAYMHLEKRAKVLSGLAISGGEPLLSPALFSLINKAKSVGLAIKIDTNGTLPDRLQSIIEDESLRPDMIAIDVKTSPSRYRELTIEQNENNFAGDALIHTLTLLQNPSVRSTIKIEYRTVLVPGLVGEAEIHDISLFLPHDADWELATFVPGECLDPSWNTIEPYGISETKRLLELAQKYIPGTKLR